MRMLFARGPVIVCWTRGWALTITRRPGLTAVHVGRLHVDVLHN